MHKFYFNNHYAGQDTHLQHLIFFEYTSSVESEVACPISLVASWVSFPHR